MHFIPSLLQLDVVLEAALQLVDAAISGNASSLGQHLPSLVERLTALMPSPLASPRATETYLRLRDTAFPDVDQTDLGKDTQLLDSCQRESGCWFIQV